MDVVETIPQGVRIILDPHVQNAIFLIGGAIIGCLILFVLILADMTPIKKDDDNDTLSY